MNIEEKKKALNDMCSIRMGCAGCPLLYVDCRFHEGEPCEKEKIDELYAIAFPDAAATDAATDTAATDTTPHIKDSGERRQFDTGAVRDIQEGKGRCDLMPLDVVANYFTLDGKPNKVYQRIHQFQNSGDIKYLEIALDEFNEQHWKNNKTMILEVAKHFEEGAKKYGEWNWQKGIPTHCYIDSAVRHYLKWARGDKDEPHDRAFVWNILCCIWTCEHKPELNDYPFVQNNKERED